MRVADYMAYYRRVKAEFEAAVGLPGEARPPVYPPVGTYPEPVEHCDVCRWDVRLPGASAARTTTSASSRVAARASGAR